jgi:hypothetical protein
MYVLILVEEENYVTWETYAKAVETLNSLEHSGAIELIRFNKL